ncbi:MAG: hypothetical protein JWN16_1613 [Alphaproteobacteria bacterium]|jgi:Protein of unknown function (DUF1453)|nr:hypothetical protein [Alphaproteobacteria bacterium]
MPHHQASQLQFIIPLLIIIPILFFRMRKMSRPEPLKLGRLWIRPALVLLGCTVVLFLPQPGTPSALHMSVAEWAGLALAAVVGAVAGWHYGKVTAIEVHPENGTLMAKGSVAGMLIIVALVAVKLGVKPALAAEGPALHLDVLLITDALIVFSAALFTARAVEIWLRAKRVMEASGRAS